ncbi:FMN-binding protein [Microbacterium sp. Sa4CUA7]|uniref:FMN-binding protein n=1 Tax=Microbacterium pullorum TaxID=2762236 RepID=A0ABR8S5E7_9MICO|nr:FMN-binding protein [Microbacterium pullorum]MBD7958702.1 FMN-binding protein [Microbacterium pullorum]
MKKIIYGILATLSGLVLVFSYRTSLEAVAPTTAGTAATGVTTGRGATPSETTGSAPDASTTAGLQEGTYTGKPVSTRYGPVQVQILVASGQISDVQVVEFPDSNGRDRQISQFAIPRLVDETVAAQNSQIDMVSGATYTSTGYIASLQSAIDQAQS